MVSHYMSGWTKGVFDTDIDPADIARFMAESCDVEILSIRSAQSEGFAIILFREEGGDRMRALRCVMAAATSRIASDAPDHEGGGVAVMDEGGAREIVRRLVEEFGGWYLASDLAGSAWEKIDPPSAALGPPVP